MEKPRLPYYAPGNRSFSTKGYSIGAVTYHLRSKGLITFQKESEVLSFSRNPCDNNELTALIHPINELGTCVFPYAYSNSRARSLSGFHDRTKEGYLFAQTEGIGLSPLVYPNEDQKWSSPTQEFPDEVQKQPLEALIQLYLKVNPDPNQRLVFVNTTPAYLETTIETFLDLATKFAEPVRITL